MSDKDSLEDEIEFLTGKLVQLQGFILDYVVANRIARGKHLCRECFYQLADDIGIERELLEEIDTDLRYSKVEGHC